jgi:hypothetical protein
MSPALAYGVRSSFLAAWDTHITSQHSWPVGGLKINTLTDYGFKAFFANQDSVFPHQPLPDVADRDWVVSRSEIKEERTP